MKWFEKIGCRTVQAGVRVAQPFLPYRRPLLLKSIAYVPAELKKNQVDRVLIVTGPNLHRMGAAEGLKRSLEEAGIFYAVYDKTESNPTVRNAEEACALYRKERCNGLIGFGGGSPMDCAKAVGVCIARPDRSLSELRGALKVRKKLPFLMEIPTTAGTGSEVSFSAVITDPKDGDKFPISDFVLIPRVSVLDGENTKSVPVSSAVAVGMDALCHGVEAYVGRATTRETRRDALEAVRLVFENVEAACLRSEDEARDHMLVASCLAGNAFSKSFIGYVHAMAHSLGGTYDLSHGMTCAVLLPSVLEAYGPRIHKKLHRLGVAAGVALASDSHKAGAEQFISALRGLNGRLGIPRGISDIRPEDIPEMARHAAKEANPLYPVPLLMDAEELEDLYYKVMERQV